MSQRAVNGYDLGRQIRDEAITATLEEEASLQEQFVSACAESFHHLRMNNIVETDLLAQNLAAAKPEEALAYWGKRTGNEPSPIIKILERVIGSGNQPVFAAVSLRTLSMGPTLFIPVPYLAARKGREDFVRSLWLNSDYGGVDKLPEEAVRFDDVVRTISHALVNISYSALIVDRPIMGWLARAHAESAAIYLPDVTKMHARDSARVVSVSPVEELFLGMASVLYLPLHDPKQAHGTDENIAPAVLMLWSPIPGRWNKIFTSTRFPAGTVQDEAPEAFTVPEYDRIKTHLWGRLRWLVNVVFKDNSELHKAELELLSFMFAMESWSAQQGGSALVQFQSFFHGSLHLLRSLRDKPADRSRLAVRDWVDDLVRAPDGFVKRLMEEWGRRLPELSLQLELWTGTDRELMEAPLGVRNEAYTTLLSAIAESNAAIEFDKATALYIASEPANNISKYAEDLTQIRIRLTRRYVTLSYIESPKQTSKERLLGSDSAFRTYYAGRRGIAVPPPTNESGTKGYGSGLGLWLYRVFAARAKVFRKLYVSPDGKEWRTEIAVPLQGGRLPNGDQSFAV